MKLLSTFVENAALALGNVFRTNLPSYVDLETSDDERTLITKRGAYVSGIRVFGSGVAIGVEEFKDVTSRITSTLNSVLRTEGHSFDFYLSADPSGAAQELDRNERRRKASAKTIGLEVDDMIEADRKALQKLAVREDAYIVIWTRPSKIGADDLKEGYKKLAEVAKATPPLKRNTQNPVAGMAPLKQRHVSLLESTVLSLKSCGIMCEEMTAHDMCHAARMAMFPDVTPEDWKVRLPGDGIPLVGEPGILRTPASAFLDYADLQHPSLASQLIAGESQRVNSRSIRMGTRIYAPAVVEVPSKEITPFSVLFERLYEMRMPWRVMFRLDGGGLNFMQTKEIVSNIFSITSKQNERITDSMAYLQDRKMDGDALVRFRVAFCTWAREGQESLLSRRFARLSQAVTSWGNTEVREKTGDVAAGVFSTVPFVCESHMGAPGAGPLDDIVKMLPLFQPASPFKSGSHHFRTLDGKLCPWQAGSSIQTTWNYALTGRPGVGKSLQMASIIYNALLAPGMKRLARASILDIGPSGMYLVEAIKESLPASMRHQVQGVKIRMDQDQTINIFDTPLGARYPTAEHRSQIVSIMTSLVTPAEMREPYLRMSELVSAVVDDNYTRFADGSARSQAKPYALGIEPEVDELIAHYGLQPAPGEVCSWWDIVDELFKRGHVQEATLAHRRAMPVIADLSTLSTTIKDVYGKVVANGQSLADAFVSLLAAVTRDFPNLNGPTVFDLGEARLVAVDLSEVSKGTTRAAKKQTGVMYMVAHYALTKDYRLIDETVESMVMPEMYKAYHMARAQEINEDLKFVVWDEFHRAREIEQVLESAGLDVREGRKFGICNIFSTQAIMDIPENIRKLITGFFICEHGGKEGADDLQRVLGLNNTTRELLVKHVNGPRKTGAPFLAHFDTKAGTFTNVLVSTLGDVTIWGLTTTAEDAVTRKTVCKLIGTTRGRRALASSYPGGVKDVIEMMKERGDKDPFRKIADDVIARAMQQTEVA